VPRQEVWNWKKVGCEQPATAQAWCTRLSGGAPDSVRCPRLVKHQLAALGKRESDVAIIHRRPVSQRRQRPTVGHAINARHVARANGRLGTPDCPVRQPIPRTNGLMHQIWKEIAHRTATVTVRGCIGLSGAPLDRRQDWPSKLASNGS
jgi:hypothetical protein